MIGDDEGSGERLRRIEAVTDATLSNLDLDHLLDELLDRVRELLGVDTAAILLLDPHAQQLESTAASGIDEELHVGTRVPGGQGFAGRVVQEKQPVMLELVDEGELTDPILRGRGVRSMLGVPLLTGGEVLGVLQVGTLEPHRFDPEDVELLRVVADRASLASQAWLGRVDRAAALALQRSLLPTKLPRAAGVEVAARYAPGHRTGVGGDWYDVFVLPSGWLGIVIGDVSGHGLPAAVVMGRLRSALRAYALECADPADALTRLDRKVLHFETGSLTTALYAMVSPHREEILVSLAGHLPPVLARPGEPAEMLSLPVDLPLGTGAEEFRHSTVVPLPEGAVVVCYTDGLVERRGDPIDAGLDRLRAAVRAEPPELVCATVMTTVGALQPTDDVALLALRRNGAPHPAGV